MPDDSSTLHGDDKLLATATDRYDSAVRFERENWDEALDDLRFAAGDQWTDEAKRIRTGRPMLQINRMGQFIRQITGDIRLNRPAVKVRPVDGESDPELAEGLTGIIRHIEQASDAQTAYNTAVENAATCGMGAFRIVTEYSADDTFEQDIRIRRIPNPFSVVWDYSAIELTREDAKWCFVVTYMATEAYKAEYPNAQVTDFEGAQRYDWIRDWWYEDRVRIAEYWVKEPVTKKLALLETGETVDVTGMDAAQLARSPIPIVRTRDVQTHKVMQYIINGAEVLEKNEWPSKYIPIVPVWGQEIHVGEKIVRHGIVRFAKDAQRMYNLHRSAAVETIALQPKVPFILTAGQIKNHENQWASANVGSPAYLLYNRDGDAQKPAREPPPSPNIAAITEANTSADDMKAVTGIYDAALGQRSNETSGKAILARQREGDVGSFVYVDNLAKAIAYCGRQLVDLIPKIYDTERVVRILGEDGSQDWLKVNQILPGGEVINDLTVGEYDVVVETGPSFSTRRQEAAESLLQFMQAAPSAAAVTMDLVAKNMDWPGADAFAKRLRKILPPGIAEPEEGEEPPPPPGPSPEQQAAMAELQMQQAKTQADIAAKEAKTQADIQALHAKTAAQIEMQWAELRADMLQMMVQQRSQERLQERGQERDQARQDRQAEPDNSLGDGLAALAQAIAALVQRQDTMMSMMAGQSPAPNGGMNA